MTNHPPIQVALLIPSTSKSRTWSAPTDSYLFNTLRSFVNTCLPSQNIVYTVWVGIDRGDEFYSDANCAALRSAFACVDVHFVTCDVEPGHVTAVWNRLAEEAMAAGCDYMYACGDDITWEKRGWVEASIHVLQSNDNIGMTGPRDIHNHSILTQCFVHKTHFNIFGFYYPLEIRNWYCDDWLNSIYTRTPLEFDMSCSNTGGTERYAIVHCPDLMRHLVERDKSRIAAYLTRSYDDVHVVA